MFEDNIFDLAAVINQHATTHPDRVAVMEPYRRRGEWTFREFTYKELARDTQRVAAGLRAHGFKEHTRTVYMAPPSYQACVISAAITAVGATQFMIDPSVGYLNVAERLSKIQPEAFIGIPLSLAGRLLFGWGPRFGQKLVSIDGRFPGAISYNKLISYQSTEHVPPAVSPDDPAVILYTTGSTGPAKPAMYLHKNFVNVFRTAHYSWRYHQDERIPMDMAAFPAFHMLAIAAGGTTIVPPINFARETPATTNPKPVAEVINAAGVRSLFASPALLERIANYADAQNMKLPTLERVIGGGAPIFEPLVHTLLRVMPEHGEVWANYGATEALPSTEHGSTEMLNETAALSAAGHGVCVGKPFPGIKMQVVGPIDQDSTRRLDFEEMPVGELGELIVQGPNISPAYFNAPESTRRNKLYDDDGSVWHRLGDVGHKDDQGRFWVEGRVSQCLHIQGTRIAPMPVEALFDQHPLVRRSGLVERTNTQGDKEAVICVEPWEKLRASEQASLKHSLADIVKKHPKASIVSSILISPGLPLDPRHNAKIERPRLAQWAQKQP